MSDLGHIIAVAILLTVFTTTALLIKHKFDKDAEELENKKSH